MSPTDRCFASHLEPSMTRRPSHSTNLAVMECSLQWHRGYILHIDNHDLERLLNKEVYLVAADAVIHTHCLALLPPLFDFGPLPSCPHGSLSLSASPLSHFSLCRISRFDDPKNRLFHVHLISLFSHFLMFFCTHIVLIVVAEHAAQTQHKVIADWAWPTECQRSASYMEFATMSFTHVTIHNSSPKAHTMHFTPSTSGCLNWISWLTPADLSYSKFQIVVVTNATWQLWPKTPCTWQHFRFTVYNTHTRHHSISRKKHTPPFQTSHPSISLRTSLYRPDVLSLSLGGTTPSSHLTLPRLRTSQLTSQTVHRSPCISHPWLATRLSFQVSPRTAHTSRLSLIPVSMCD